MYKQISLKKNFYQTQIYPNLIKNELLNILPKVVKKGKQIYSFRRVFIILSDSFPNFQNELSFNIYYPVSKINNINNKYSLPNPSNNIIITNNLSDICCEVCKIIDLDIEQHSYKLNIYNQNFNVLTSDDQLYNYENKNNIIYVKVTKFNPNEELRNFDRCEYHRNPRPKYFNTSSNFFRLSHQQFFKTRQNKINFNYNFTETNFLTQKKFQFNNNEISYNNFPKIKAREHIKKNTFSSLSKEETDKGDYDFSALMQNFYNSRLNSDKSSKIFSPKIIRNIHLNNNNNNIGTKIKKIIISPQNLGIVSPRKYHTEPNDKYIITKSPKNNNKFEYNNSNINNNINNENKNDKVNDNESLNDIQFNIYQNKKFLNEINEKITDFTINQINEFISDENLSIFQELSLNYNLTNDMSDFPVIKLKKQFIFYSYLSQNLEKKQNEFCQNFYKLYRNDKNNNFNFIFNIRNFREVINDIFKEFNISIKHKDNFIYMMSNYKEKISISYLFMILFIFFHKDLSFKTDKDLVYILLKSIKIIFGMSLDFQTFCDYLIFLTRNKFISFDQKFMFLKEFVNNLFLHKNRHELLMKSKKYFSINTKDFKLIVDNDIKKIKQEENKNEIPKIEEIYNKIINYYTY